jgi:hypothetical protein
MTRNASLPLGRRQCRLEQRLQGPRREPVSVPQTFTKFHSIFTDFFENVKRFLLFSRKGGREANFGQRDVSRKNLTERPKESHVKFLP